MPPIQMQEIHYNFSNSFIVLPHIVTNTIIVLNANSSDNFSKDPITQYNHEPYESKFESVVRGNS